MMKRLKLNTNTTLQTAEPRYRAPTTLSSRIAEAGHITFITSSFFLPSRRVVFSGVCTNALSTILFVSFIFIIGMVFCP